MAGQPKKRLTQDVERNITTRREAIRNEREILARQALQSSNVTELRKQLIESDVGDIHVLWRNKILYNGRPEDITEKMLCDVLIRSHGIYAVACRILGVQRWQLVTLLSKSQKARRIVAEERENILDMSECRLFEAAAAGQEWAVKFMLSTLGKHRGYSTEDKPANNKGLIMDVIEAALDEEDPEADRDRDPALDPNSDLNSDRAPYRKRG